MLKKSTFWITVIACAIVWTVLIAHNRHVGYFAAETSVYPMQLRDDSKNATVNPCFKLRRLLSSDDFKESVIRNAAIAGLNGDSYHRIVYFHETNDHQIRLHVYMRDSAAALSLSSLILQQIAQQLPPVACPISLHEAPVADYMHGCTCSDTVAVDCCEITDSPHIVCSPSPLQLPLLSLLSLVFSFLTIGAIVQLWKSIRS